MVDLSLLLRRFRSAPETDGRFGFAVVGLGRIAEHFLRGIESSAEVRATALVSGDARKARKLARQWRVPYTCSYTEFETLRERPDVHAVYLALPPSMHREFTARAAAIGKHVLVEKPMATTSADCRAMIADCAAADVRLSVAYRCVHDPMHRRLHSLIEKGSVGRIERVESAFGFVLAAGDWRFNAALAGGGSMFDVGVYPLNAARFLLGSEPQVLSATATKNADGLETEILWNMRFPDGTESRCKSSFLEKLDGTLAVHGTAGQFALDPAFTHREPTRLRGWYTDPVTTRRISVDESSPRDTPSHFQLEAEHLSDAVRKRTPIVTTGEDALCDIELIEAMYAVAKTRKVPQPAQ